MGKGATVDLTNPTNLIAVLESLTAPDTKIIKTAEKALKPFMKNPANAVYLIALMRTCESTNVRHHAALLLAKKVKKFYTKYGPQQQLDLRNELVHIMLAEPFHPIAIAVASNIAAVAQTVFESGEQWPELFNLLIQLSQDPNEKHRKLVFTLINELSDTIVSYLKPHAATVAQLFGMGFSDAAVDVTVAAAEAATHFVDKLGNCKEVMAMSNVIPPAIALVTKALQSEEEETICETLNFIIACFETEEPIMNDHMESLTPFLLAIIQNGALPGSIRQSATLAVEAMIKHRPKLFAKKGLVAPTLSALMGIVALQEGSSAGALYSFLEDDAKEKPAAADGDEDDSSYEDDEDDDEMADQQREAQVLIDLMAVNIPSKYFADIALGLISQGISSPDAKMRKAGFAVLGIIAEGCMDKIIQHMNDIVPSLLIGLRDPEHYVRECACFALGQFSEFCQPDILYHHQTILPAVFQVLEEPRLTLQASCCYVLEYFCENLQPDTLRPFLPALMNKLAMLLQADNGNIKQMTLSAIAATAVAAEKNFLPYADPMCGILQKYIFLTEPKQISVRGRALECWGHIAVALGEEHFGPYFELGMQSAVQGVQLDDESLKEHCFVYVANTVKVMKGSLEKYLPSLVPYMFDVIEESELHNVDEDDEEEADEEAEHKQEKDQEDAEPVEVELNVTEGFVNTKKAALTAIGAVAENIPTLFRPYMERGFHALLTEEMGSFYSLHDVLRAESASILQFFVKAAAVSSGMKINPGPGEVLAVTPDAATALKTVFAALIKMITEDEEKLPVAYACESLEGILKIIGPAALMISTDRQVMITLMNAVLILLSEKAPCQAAVSAEKRHAAEDGEDDGDHDTELMDAVVDLISALALVLGADFIPYFDEFHKLLMRFTKPSRPHTDRSMAIGCYGEVISRIGPGCVKYADQLLPIFQHGLSDSMESVRRNSAYSIGAFVEAAGQATVPHYMTFLHWLHPVCIRKAGQVGTDSGGADVDNALSSVCKMINIAPAAVPLSQVLPVILQALPLTGDNTEGPNIYQCLATLVLKRDPAATSLLPQLITVFAEPLQPTSNSTQETKTICANSLKELLANADTAPQVNAFLATIADPILQQNIRGMIV